MKYSHALNLFLVAARGARRSSYTVLWYRQYIGRLIEFTNDANIQDISIEQLRLFFAFLSTSAVKYSSHPYRCRVDSGLSDVTILGIWQAVRALYNWLEENEYIERQQNVARRLSRPHVSRLSPKSVTNENLIKMLAAAKKFGEQSRRDYALLLFLLETGCRVGGLISLVLEDLNLSRGVAMVTEKGDKSRPVFFTAQTQKALRAWLKVRPPVGNFVFTTETGQQLTRWGLRQIVDRTKRRAGVVGKTNLHGWRHAFARLYIENGGDLATLSDLMGHSDVSVTKKSYLVFVQEQLKKKHSEYSPLLGLNDGIYVALSKGRRKKTEKAKNR
jgi:site-specific recombinase XerD